MFLNFKVSKISSSLIIQKNHSAPNQSGRTPPIDNEVNSVLILDEQTFAPKWSFFLDPTEVGQALLSTTLGSEKKSYLIVGTAYCVTDEPESKKGRLLVFDWTDDGKVILLNEI